MFLPILYHYFLSSYLTVKPTVRGQSSALDSSPPSSDPQLARREIHADVLDSAMTAGSFLHTFVKVKSVGMLFDRDTIWPRVIHTRGVPPGEAMHCGSVLCVRPEAKRQGLPALFGQIRAARQLPQYLG